MSITVSNIILNLVKNLRKEGNHSSWKLSLIYKKNRILASSETEVPFSHWDLNALSYRSCISCRMEDFVGEELLASFVFDMMVSRS